MTTVNKDFKVKHGIQVTGDGVFGGSIIAADPTLPTHVATKAYVDSLAGGVPTGTTPPENPENGLLWFDSLVERLNVYFAGSWITIAAIDDTLTLTDHIHDTSIDGDGRIVTTFTSGGGFNDPQGSPVDGGGPETTEWTLVLDGGSPVDNFN